MYVALQSCLLHDVFLCSEEILTPAFVKMKEKLLFILLYFIHKLFTITQFLGR